MTHGKYYNHGEMALKSPHIGHVAKKIYNQIMCKSKEEI